MLCIMIPFWFITVVVANNILEYIPNLWKLVLIPVIYIYIYIYIIGWFGVGAMQSCLGLAAITYHQLV